MTTQEIIEANTEDGTTNWEAVEEAIQDQTQTQIGAAVSKYKNKTAKQKAELAAEAEEAKNAASNKDEDLAKALERLNKLEQDQERKAAAKEFKKKAAELNVDESLVDEFIASGAKLESIDLEKFKGADVKKAGAHAPSEDDEDKQAAADEKAQMQAALKAARAARVV